MSYETISSLIYDCALQKRLFYNKSWRYSSVRVEEIPQGKPYKFARNIVEHKETSINKGLST